MTREVAGKTVTTVIPGTVRGDCGTAARYAGRRPKTFATVLGDMTLDRAYYHGGACAGGFCPRDRVLDLDGTALSHDLISQS